MVKNKLKKFTEVKTFSHVIEPSIEELRSNFLLKGKWKQDFFKNNNPLVLELACGKGEYSVSLAKKYPKKNFLGVDIKGSRIWAGAKEVLNENITNVGFLRIRIEFIEYCFDKKEVDEIWIVFPDPHEKERSISKRLTHSNFLEKYQNILQANGLIHLKTDNIMLYKFTLEMIEKHNHFLKESTNDLYKNQGLYNSDLYIQTHYEQIFLSQRKKITYIQFALNYKI